MLHQIGVFSSSNIYLTLIILLYSTANFKFFTLTVTICSPVIIAVYPSMSWVQYSTIIYISVIANERQQQSSLTGTKQTMLHYWIVYLTVSIPVSMFLSSLLTAVITTFIVYLIMRRRSYNKDSLLLPNYAHTWKRIV